MNSVWQPSRVNISWFVVGGLFILTMGCTRSLPSDPAPNVAKSLELRKVILAPPTTAEAGAGSTDAPATEAWGTLTGRFVLDGGLPTAKNIDTGSSNDPVCRAVNVPDETIVAGPDGGLENVVIFLRPARGAKVAVHPSFEESAKAEVVLDNKDCRFQPHALVMRTSQTLLIKNSDPTAHNSRITPLNSRNNAANPIIPAGASQPYNFNVEENLPVVVGCNIHPWMASHVVVRDNPYAAVSGPDGRFVIENLPVGKHEFQVKHVDTVYITEVNIGGQSAQWPSGRPKLDVKEGSNDLGDIKVPLALLKK